VDSTFGAFLRSWSFDPTVIIGVTLAAVLYARGWRVLQRHTRRQAGLQPWRAWCFYFGLFSISIALLSPIGTYGELFFFMHMTQHMLLIIFGAPFVLLGAPLVPIMLGLPRSVRGTVGYLFSAKLPFRMILHLLTTPLVAMVIFLIVIGIWHVPRYYDAAQGASWIHYLEHVMFLGAALLYWWPVIHPSGGKRRLGYGPALGYLLPSLVQGMIIGAILTFAKEPLYETYKAVPRVWGLSALADQQLAGIIMWLVGGFIYLVPVFVLLSLFMKAEEEEPDARQSERAYGA
jgi:cytochrome c oxidase assembly factor CtaG